MAKGEVVVMGSGLMGSSIAIDLLESSSVSKVTVIDSSGDRLRALEMKASKLSGLDPNTGSNVKMGEKLDTLEMDVLRKKDDLLKILPKFDIGVGALPHGIAEEVVQRAVEAGISFVDLIYSWRHERSTTIDSKARQKGITIVPACGLAPGLTSILAKYAADQMEEVDSVRIKVGGIPEVPKAPLNYKVVFAIESVIEEYVRDALVVRDGKKTTVPALTDVEEVSFSELPDQKFEAFLTDGLSTLPDTLKKVKVMEEKTIRWKGHAEQVQLLMDLGLFSERPVNLKTTGARVSPRALLSTLMEKKLAMHQGDKDMTLLRVDVEGRKRKGDKSTRIHEYEMIDRFDSDAQTTSMARTTAHPCSTVVLMILEGKITERGFIPPELAIKDDRFDDFVARLERKGPQHKGKRIPRRLTSRRKVSSPKIRAKPSYFRLKKSETKKTPRKVVTVLKVLSKTVQSDKIPTSLVSLSPDKLVAEKQIDVLVGLFHIMWEDMPRPRTYSIRLADLVTFEGEYVGTALNQGKSAAIDLWRFSEGTSSSK